MAMLLFLVYCGDKGGGEGGKANINTLTLFPIVGRISIGSMVQITATGTYPDSSTIELTNHVAWSSSDLSVATASSSGIVTGVSVGTATITAAYGLVSSNTVVTVVIGTASKIAAGGAHSLAIDSNGALWAWGYNNYGELGDGTNVNSNMPVRVSGLTGVTEISGGEGHTLALDSNGAVWSWGANVTGQLGNGTSSYTNTPGQVSGLSGVSSTAAGGLHSVAVKSDSTVWCWGYNTFGALGDGTNNTSYVPIEVRGF